MYMVEAWLHVRDVCSDLRVGTSVVGSIPSISREDFSCKSKMLFTIKHILGPSPFHLLSTTNNKNIIEFAWLFLAAAKRYGHAFKDQTNNPEQFQDICPKPPRLVSDIFCGLVQLTTNGCSCCSSPFWSAAFPRANANANK